MKYEVIPKKDKIQSFVYIADTAGCGTIRVMIPSMLLNQWFVQPQVNQFFLPYFTKDLGVYRDMAYVVFQRSATLTHLELITLFKKKIKPLTKTGLLYESDDYLIDIPKWNFAYEYYIKYKTYILEMLQMVDGITVSTEKLKELYSPFNKNISVIPNHLCKFIWGEAEPKVRDTKRLRILYPCSSNHFALKRMNVKGGDIGPVLLDYIRKTVDEHEWVFVGAIPQELEDLLAPGKVTRHMWKTVYHYPGFLRSLEGDIGIAPLEINTFNECKSNIKVLEFSAIGIPGVYSKVYPYKDCKLTGETEEEFISKIEMLKDPDLRLQTWNLDYNLVKEQLYWEENDNILKYMNGHLNLFGKEMKL